MEKFEFSSRKLTVDFPGVSFTARVKSSIGAKAIVIGKKIEDVDMKIEEGLATESDAIELYTNYINDLLEDESAVEKIFTEKEITREDLADAALYITSKFTAENNRIIEKYTPYIQQNRQQRRASK